MRKSILLPAMLACVTFAFTQEQVDTKMMQQIKDEEKNHSQITWIAHNLTDVCGARLTNSPGYNRALNWLTETFNNWKLTNVNKEPWGEFGKGWSTESVYIALKQPYYQPVIAYPLAWSGSTNNAISSEVILLDKLDSASIDKLGDNIKGKIVLVKLPDTTKLHSAFVPFAKRYDSSQLDTLPDTYMLTREEITHIMPAKKRGNAIRLYLQQKGALAILTSNTSERDGTIFVSGTQGYAAGYGVTIPQLMLSLEDHLKIQRLLVDKKPVAIEMNVQNKFYTDDLTGYNMIGEIEGTDPTLKSEVVMLGGHLDSWHSGTGATDNGAGCIVMMEVMRILKALNVQPKRTIRIALWGGEEQGLLGSFGYVKKHFGNPADMNLKPEQKKISAYYNLDNGSGKVRGIFLQNNEKLRDIFKAWLAPFADMGATGITKSNTGSTDHLSFDAVGIPGFQFIQDPLEYETRTHHSNMDTYDHLSIEDLQQAATVIAAFVYNTAMRNEMLPRKLLSAPGRFVFDLDGPL